MESPSGFYELPISTNLTSGAGKHTMGPRGYISKDVRKFEQEKLREFTLDLWKLKKSYNEIAAEASKVFLKPVSKSTIQSIIKRFQNRTTVCDKARKGRKPVFTAQYVIKINPEPCIYLIFRYRRQLKKLASANPFRGATWLRETLHSSIVAAISNRPSGAVIQVCHSLSALVSLLIVRSQGGQARCKFAESCKRKAL